MACLSLVSCSHSHPCRLKSSLVPSYNRSNNLSRNSLYSITSPPRKARAAVISCASFLVHEAQFWNSVQPPSFCLLLSPSILILLLLPTTRNKARLWWRFSTSSIFFGVRKQLHSFWQWRGVQRQVVQILTVLVLATAFYANIAAPDPSDTFENVPQDLSGGEKRKRIQRPKSRKAEICTQKCVGTCIRGGAGSPGEGPLNVRRPLVVFKEGFRSRQYWSSFSLLLDRQLGQYLELPRPEKSFNALHHTCVPTASKSSRAVVALVKSVPDGHVFDIKFP